MRKKGLGVSFDVDGDLESIVDSEESYKSTKEDMNSSDSNLSHFTSEEDNTDSDNSIFNKTSVKSKLGKRNISKKEKGQKTNK